MNAHFLKVSRTARYYLLGNENNPSKITFVFHGYGQLAEELIPYFEAFDQNEHLFVFPEALSRFYRSKFSGQAVASWMTTEMREQEIEDYVNYFSALYLSIKSHVQNEFQLNLLGFSQGTATAGRIALGSGINVNKLICFAGEPPFELLQRPEALSSLDDFYMTFGNEDEFYPENQQKLLIEKWKAVTNLQFVSFKGKHQLEPEVLKSLLN